MRSALLVVAVTACSSPSGGRPGALADAAPDAVVDHYDRTVNAVLVAGDHVYWSHGRFACPLEFPCAFEGPAVTSWWRDSNRASVRHDGGVGARSIVGDETERFFVTGLDLDSMYVVRDRGVPVAFSVPRPLTVGPAIDATHVYWADTTFTSTGYTLRRATRAGDGSDATVLATDVPMHGDASELVVAAGYAWWIANGKVHRTPVTGGTASAVAAELAGHPVVLAPAGDVIHVASVRDSGTSRQVVELGRIDAAGAYTALAEHAAAPPRWPRFLVAAPDGLYWSVRDGNIYRAPLAGGSVETIAANDRVGHAFALLPGQIFVELTGDSFRAIPRP